MVAEIEGESRSLEGERDWGVPGRLNRPPIAPTKFQPSPRCSRHFELQCKAMSKLMGMQFKVVYKQGKDNKVDNALNYKAFVLTINRPNDPLSSIVREGLIHDEYFGKVIPLLRRKYDSNKETNNKTLKLLSIVCDRTKSGRPELTLGEGEIKRIA